MLKHSLIGALTLFSCTAFADDQPCGCEKEEEKCLEECSREAHCHEDCCFFFPFERARPYDAELETETTWPGKREDAFYDWLTR